MRFSTYEEMLELCRSRSPEGLELEFKEKTSPGKPDLENDDKKAISKAVSAFANSGGGTLIFGIRTSKVGDVDVATEVRPISDLEVSRTQVEYVCKTNVSPEIRGLKVKGIAGPGGKGVVICEVPGSDRRPHMSTAPKVHTYYRRTFQGNVPMTPFEVKEQVLAVREALIVPTARVGRGASFSTVHNWIAIGYSIQFAIENVGGRACVNPFLRVRASEKTRSYGANFDARLGMWKSNLPYGTLIHVDDALQVFSLEFVARLLTDKLLFGSTASENELLEAVRLYGQEDDLHSKTITDKLEIRSLSFELTYGAENAAVRTETFNFDRKEIAARILINSEEHLRERALHMAGVWRSDLVTRLKAAYPD